MQTAAVERDVKSSGAMASAEFGISQAHAAHIMGILRSTLYSRKALAVLREYGANAWDEHRQAGIGDRPIKVTLPTVFKPILKIRDFGRGLSEHDVLHLYTQYGESTKRESNTASGMLGIGCKAGFAYADSFTVTSWHGGTKSVYVAVLDKSNKGRMDKVHESPCGDETGVEIQIAAKPRDVDEFNREARHLYRYFNPQPEINLALAPLPKGMTRGFVIDGDRHSSTEWIAVMGCIPYRLDLEQLKEPLVEAGVWEALSNLSGGVYLPIGSVEFSASREELQYTEVTIKAVSEQLKDLVQEYIDDALAAIDQPNVLSWDRRLKVSFLHHILKFPLPKQYKVWLEPTVLLYSREKESPKTFTLVDHDKTQTSRVSIGQDSHILILDDTSKSLKGWRFQYHKDVLALPNEGCTYEQVKAEIEALCVKAQIEGMPIAAMTTRAYWQAPYTNGRRQYPPNQKHKDRTFKLHEHISDSVPRSNTWDSVEPPEDEHVYVIISEFIPKGSSLIALRDDKELVKSFGIEWPTIYGYKTTTKKPVTDADIENGISYAAWREKTFGALINDDVKATLRDIAWGRLFQDLPYKYRQGRPDHINIRDLIAKLSNELGEKHPLTRFLSKHIEARKALSKLAKGRESKVTALAKAAGYKQKRSPTKEWLSRLLTAYPMLKVSVETDNHLAGSLHEHFDTVIAYIKDIDARNGGSTFDPEA